MLFSAVSPSVRSVSSMNRSLTLHHFFDGVQLVGCQRQHGQTRNPVRFSPDIAFCRSSLPNSCTPEKANDLHRVVPRCAYRNHAVFIARARHVEIVLNTLFRLRRCKESDLTRDLERISRQRNMILSGDIVSIDFSFSLLIPSTFVSNKAKASSSLFP